MSQRLVLIIVAAVIGAMLLGGCSDSSTSTDPQPTARIRVIHASPDFGTVDVYLGNATTPWLKDLEYLQTGTYLTINSPATVTLAFRRAGDPVDATPLLTSDELSMSSGSSTSAVVGGLAGSNVAADELRLLTYTDTWLAHDTGKTRVRVIHAGANARDLTVVAAGGLELATDLPRFEASVQGGELYPAAVSLENVIYVNGLAIASFAMPALDEDKDYYFVITGLISSVGADAFTLLPVGPGGSLALETPSQRTLPPAIR